MNAQHQLNILHTQADTVTAAGGTVTQRFQTIRARWTSLFVRPDRAADLAAKITAEDDVDAGDLADLLTAANSAALAGSKPGHTADVLNAVAAAVLPVQRAEWAKTLPDNYARVAKAYNQAAAALTAALAVVDPDTAPEDLLTAPARSREAWGQAPTLAAQLDEAADALCQIGSLLDVDAGPEGLGLLAQLPADADRRKVFTALDGAHGRTGKWGTLHQLGAKLTAPARPEDVHPYRRPKPIETRYQRTATGLLPVDYDPETNTPADAIPAGGPLRI